MGQSTYAWRPSLLLLTNHREDTSPAHGYIRRGPAVFRGQLCHDDGAEGQISIMSNPPLTPVEQAQRRIRLMLVDDMPQVLHDLRQLLELTGLVEIVAEAGSGLEAVRLAGERSPEAILLDLEMPGIDGYETTRRIKGQTPDVRVIILSVHADAKSIEHARAAGADAFVQKGASYGTLIRAILGPAIPSSMGDVNKHE